MKKFLLLTLLTGINSIILAQDVKLSAGINHSLFVCPDGTVNAWGNNMKGQLGINSTSDKYSPKQVHGFNNVGFLTDVKSISGGRFQTLVLKNDSTVWGWGYNVNGQLGDGTTTDRHTPVQVIGLNNSSSYVIAISAGAHHALALKSDGTVWAWGQNGNGQLGDGTTTNRTSPVQVSGLTGIIAIAGGAMHSLALKNDSTVWAWGSNLAGQLGDSTMTTRSTPVQVHGPGSTPFLTGIIAIAKGDGSHSLALKSDGTVWAWGSDMYQQLGNITFNNLTSTTPIQVTGLTNIIAIANGNDHSLALKNDSTVWTWGSNSHGELGDGTTASGRDTAKQVSGLTDIVAIAGGGNAYCLALKNDGTLWTWGNNPFGQIGDGTGGTQPIYERHAPVQVISLCTITTEINESSVNDLPFTIYPNPANDHVYVSFTQDVNNAKIKLLNMMGQTIFEKANIHENTLAIDISNQPGGIYFVELYSGNSVSRVKLIKD